MPSYRRSGDGRLFFLTLVTHRRRAILTDQPARQLLHDAIDRTGKSRPWTMEAIVLLPDHLHMLWRLPAEDVDYSARIGAIKKRFTRAFLAAGGTEGSVSDSQDRQRLRGVWQKRFWEHAIRDAEDYRLHLDYIHTNPVKHGLVYRPVDWPWSSFHRHVEQGAYEADWRGRADLPGSVEYIWNE